MLRPYQISSGHQCGCVTTIKLLLREYVLEEIQSSVESYRYAKISACWGFIWAIMETPKKKYVHTVVWSVSRREPTHWMRYRHKSASASTGNNLGFGCCNYSGSWQKLLFELKCSKWSLELDQISKQAWIQWDLLAGMEYNDNKYVSLVCNYLYHCSTYM